MWIHRHYFTIITVWALGLVYDIDIDINDPIQPGTLIKIIAG